MFLLSPQVLGILPEQAAFASPEPFELLISSGNFSFLDSLLSVLVLYQLIICLLENEMKKLRNWLLGSVVFLMTTLVWAVDLAEDKTADQVVLATSKGNIVIQLAPEVAPITVNNFLQYVTSGFYDGLVFHRVIDDFMIQGGGFTPDMAQKTTRAAIKNESQLDDRQANQRGSIAMARTAAIDSATSQFFINLRDNNFLDGHQGKPGYAVFGQVIEGMDVVDAIAKVKTGRSGGHSDVPLDPVVINKAYIATSQPAQAGAS